MAMNPGTDPRRVDAQARHQRDRDRGAPRARRRRRGTRSAPACPFSTTCWPSWAATAASNLRGQSARAISKSMPTTPSRTPASCSARRSPEALGAKVGVRRFASIAVPLDEALVDVALDLSGRPYLHYDVELGETAPARQPALRGPAGRGVLAGFYALGGHHLAHRASSRAQPPPRPRSQLQGGRPGSCVTPCRHRGHAPSRPPRASCRRAVIAVLDYGIGNLALRREGPPARRVPTPASSTVPRRPSAASGVVLPGVGAFGACARALRALGARRGGPALCKRGPTLPRYLRRPAAALRGLGGRPAKSPASASCRASCAPSPPSERRPQMQWNLV